MVTPSELLMSNMVGDLLCGVGVSDDVLCVLVVEIAKDGAVVSQVLECFLELSLALIVCSARHCKRPGGAYIGVVKSRLKFNSRLSERIASAGCVSLCGGEQSLVLGDNLVMVFKRGVHCACP